MKKAINYETVRRIIFSLCIIAACLFCRKVNAQSCPWGNKKASFRDQPTVTIGVLADWSLTPVGQTDFQGTAAHVGIWADHIGLFAGFVQSKVADKIPATQDGSVTIALRYQFFDGRLQFSPYFAAGTNNYQDFGMRTGWRLNDGVYFGVQASRTMHYGVSVQLSIFQK